MKYIEINKADFYQKIGCDIYLCKENEVPGQMRVILATPKGVILEAMCNKVLAENSNINLDEIYYTVEFASNNNKNKKKIEICFYGER